MSLRRLILHNFWLKFFSVALATVIWMAIHYGIHNDFPVAINRFLVQKYIRVPVSVIIPAGDRRIFKVTPTEVVVFAVGEELDLQKAAPKDIRVYVDLTQFHSRTPADAEVRPDVPKGIDVREITPPVVSVVQISP